MLAAVSVHASVRSNELPAPDATGVNGQPPDCRAGGGAGFDPARAVVLPHIGPDLCPRLLLPLRLNPLIYFPRLSEAHDSHHRWSGRPHPRSRDFDTPDCPIRRSHFDEAVVGREAHGLEVQPRRRPHGSLHSGQYDPVRALPPSALPGPVRALRASGQRVSRRCPQYRGETAGSSSRCTGVVSGRYRQSFRQFSE